MPTFEFISLRCIKQNELGSDDILVRVGGRQVFPVEGVVHFKKGRSAVNPMASLTDAEIDALLGDDRAVSIADFGNTAGLTPRTVPIQGLVVEVWEEDVVSRPDKLGRVMVLPEVTEGAVTKRLDDALTGVYELTYQVVADAEEVGAT